MPRPPSPPKTALGAAMRARRGSMIGLTAAEELGLHHDHYYRLERGTHRPTYDTAVKLARWLGWTVERVMDAADQPAPTVVPDPLQEP